MEHPRNKNRIKIKLFGGANAGKSGFLTRYSENYFIQDEVPSIGADSKFKTIVSPNTNKVIDLNLHDTGASRGKFIPLDSPYYQGYHGIMLMFDCTDRKSFTEMPLHFNQIEQLFAAKTTQKMLVATKIDLADQRKISFEEAKQLADNLGVPYIETSAKDNIKVTEAVNMLVRNVEIVAETNFRMLVHEVHKEIENLPALLDETPTHRNWTPRCTIL